MKQYLFYLSGFNNYYNRQVKKAYSTSVSDYEDFIVLSTPLTAFNPNDGLTTSMDVNYNNLSDDIDLDYLIVSNDSTTIDSRWFVIDRTRNLSGQWKVSLKRDLMADYINSIQTSPCYIEKARVSTSNPLIWNSENFSVNQIKQNEFLLKDSSKTPWIAIYFSRETSEGQQSTGGTITCNADVVTQTDLSFSYSRVLELASTSKPVKNKILNEKDTTASFIARIPRTANSMGGARLFVSDGTSSIVDLPETGTKFVLSDSTAPSKRILEAFKNGISDNELYTDMANYLENSLLVNSEEYALLSQLAGKTVKDTDSDTLFTINVEQTVNNFDITVEEGSSLYNSLYNVITSIPYVNVFSTASQLGNTIKVSGTYQELRITSVKITSVNVVKGPEIQITIPAANARANLRDAPWDMMVMPYESTFIYTPSVAFNTEDNIAKAIAQEALADLGSQVIDVQLLPYCPCLEYYNDTINGFRLSTLVQDVDYSIIKKTQTEEGDSGYIGIGIWCTKSSFRSNVVGFTPITVPNDPIDFKIENECDFYRLCSPNYAGAFEFSATKNKGITGFEINCTYKPFQPYIQVNPVFSGLYGKDFNDSRGLICEGNFSMPSTSNSWVQYQTLNKSYKESFDRQITNMETTYNLQREQQKTAAVIQTLSGALGGGASAGLVGSSLIGGPAGAIGASVGALAGVGAGIAGAIKDLEFADAMFKESKSYAEDRFNLSLQNIQAMPNTIKSAGAFDINNKLYPFLEFYSCTQQEKDALKAKLEYSGFTVNACGLIGNFLYTGGGEEGERFIRAQLIRLVDADTDYHLASAIAKELAQGVYF